MTRTRSTTQHSDAALPVRPVRLREGDELPRAVAGPLTRTDFVRYAGAGGDLNAVHHDETVAQRAGLPSVFGMGMLHAGMLGNRLARWVGPDNIRSFSVRFTSQVWPGDELTFSGHVTRLERQDDGHAHAEITLSIVNQSGQEVLRGQATALVSGQDANCD
ncbi:MAG TPA: MaoC/PaaZ C-terminal domain-containing protein [Solirubrobacteraceae bacterium]|nr:MaoC/PaaZ C-terminal domain-containing protein [Solirubrobacteraceae bacterium]